MNLVTGATGLVGMHIAIDLLRKDEKVKATYTNPNNIEKVKKVFIHYEIEHLFNKIDWIEMDLEDITQVYEAVKGMDYVYHSAAVVSFNKKDRKRLMNINVKGTANIVNACIDEKIKKLGFISSVAAIGRSGNGNYSETNKWVESNDNSYYAISKYKAENEVWRGIEEGLNAVITNPGIIIGPSNWNRSSTTIFKQIHKGLSFFPEGKNGFVDARDVSKSIVNLVKSNIRSERFIIVGDNLFYKEIFQKIAEKIKVKKPSKKASRTMLEIAWRIVAIKCFITRKNPGLTKETARTSSKINIYDNQKIKTKLEYEFYTLDEAIDNTSKFILKTYC